VTNTLNLRSQKICNNVINICAKESAKQFLAILILNIITAPVSTSHIFHSVGEDGSDLGG
jgi:hypothetical protein